MPSSARARLNFARTYGNIPAPVGVDVSTTRAWLDSAPGTDCELGAIPTNDRTNSALCEILRFAQNDKAGRRCVHPAPVKSAQSNGDVSSRRGGLFP